jgi:hypothetical protein
VDYGGLKKRVKGASEGIRRTSPISTEFVELSAGPLLGRAEASGTRVELWEADGAKLVVRLAEGEGLDVGSLAESFWRRRG